VKRKIDSFITFTRTEKLGLVALSVLLLVLITARFCMHFFIHPVALEKNDSLRIAWEKFKKVQQQKKEAQKADSMNVAGVGYQKRSGRNPISDKIYINSSDSATFAKIRGIGPKVAHKILRFRKYNTRFTSIEQFTMFCGISDDAYAKLKGHIVLE